jgi:hypothetical protein
MQNIFNKIQDDLSYSGKLNSILYINLEKNEFKEIYQDFIDVFKPNEVYSSCFDIKSIEVLFIDNADQIIDSSEIVSKKILVRDNEQIIIEYYQNNLLVNHVVNSDILDNLLGYSLIEKYLTRTVDPVLILGFELCIEINLFDFSLQCSLNDKSLYPIFLIKKKFILNKYTNDYSGSTTDVEKEEIIVKYLKNININ